MTKSEVLAFVQSVRAHELEDAVMLRWLDELEKKVNVELHGRLSREKRVPVPMADQLSVASPYDKIYWTYLLAMIELTKGTPQSYELASAVFKEAWSDYARHVQRLCGFGKRRARM